MSEGLLEEPLRLKQWISSCGDSDHFPIILEIVVLEKTPSIAFKFNVGWLLEEDYSILVKEL